MTEVKVVGPDQLNLSEFVQLQREAFAEVIGKTGMDYLLSEQAYRWKYSSPFGPAKVALVYEDGRLVAANSMYPMAISWQGKQVTGWQSCDTATHPSARGKGYFLKCLYALKSELKQDEIFFGFPNKNSGPGFVKFGWNVHGAVTTWVRALPGAALSRFPSLTELKSFGACENEFFRDYSAGRGPFLGRSDHYMNWRYFQHPLNRYAIYAHTDGGKTSGIVVLRNLTLGKRNLAIVMELLALDRNAEIRLLKFAAAWARSQGILFTLALNNTLSFASALPAHFYPVPARLLPKQQLLMGSASGPLANEIWREPWCVQIGDWDGF